MTPFQAQQEIDSLIQKIANSGDADIQTLINNWRRRVVLMIAENEPLDVLTVETLKARIRMLAQQAQQIITKQISDNQRRLFIKGIQTVDNIIKANGIRHALPFLSETKLNALQRFSADQIKGLTDNAIRSISTELDLALLGQKTATEVIANIGKNLDDPSVFGTVARRAQIIYQTEVKRVQNMTTVDRITQAKQQVQDVGKKWVHSHIGIPRPGHLMLDGTVVAADEQFELVGADGGVYSVDGPYDPELPVGEIVNCRCTVVPVVMRFLDQTA